MYAINKDSSAIEFASNRFQSNKKVVLDAINNDKNDWAYILKYVSEELRDDEEVIYAAINNENYEYESILQFASERLCGDKKVVMAAIENDYSSGYNLKYASTILQNDPEIINASITRVGESLKFASCYFKNDLDTVLLAVNASEQALYFVGEELKCNPTFLAKLNGLGIDYTEYF